MLNGTTLRWRLSVILITLMVTVIPVQVVSGQSPVVHAVLFFSPSCPHCHKIMTEDLPPLQRNYAEQLDILFIDTSTVEGATLYKTAVETYKIPDDRQGVPTMIVNDTVLVGSLEIPGEFPGIITRGLAAGGVDWPKLSGLDTFLENRAKEPPPSAGVRIWNTFQRDLLANILAVIVLIGLIITLFYNLHLFDRRAIRYKGTRKPADHHNPGVNGWSPALIVIGLLVALYMTYIEMTLSEALCGPVGDCNTVQQSPYATLFGILPVGMFGIFGYVCLGVALFFQYVGSHTLRNYSAVLYFAFAVFGVAFCIYLTMLEPFVIGASCLWCLSTAVIMALILFLATKPAILAWNASHVKPHKRH